MIIQHNLMAVNTHRQLSVNTKVTQDSLEKLSSGYRINRAADDAAGLAISEKMRAQITGLDRAGLNAQDGVSFIQTAEGALTEVHDMLNRMMELAVESANGIYAATERTKIEDEITALKDEIDRISAATNFNGLDMLSGRLSGMGKAEATTYPQGELIAPDRVHIGNDFTFSGAPESFLKNGSGDVTVSPSPNPATASGLTFTVAHKDGGTISYTIDLSGKINLGAGSSYTVDLTPFGKIPIQNSTYTSLVTEPRVIRALANYLNNPNMTITPSEGGLTLQVGDTSDEFNKITIFIEDMSSSGLNLSDVNMLTQDSAASAIDSVRSAIELVSGTRSSLGALQNRLEHTISNLAVMSENMTASESRIRDTDMAKEMMTLTKSNIVGQAAQAMLSQANTQPQQVLQLLR